MRNLCLTLSRFAISAWVGAAGLFVVTTLKEVHSPKLDSVAKAELAALRFPVYYMFAFGLIAAALVLSAGWPATVTRLQRWTSVSLLVVLMLMTTIDYVWIYSPLLEMTAAVDQARPAKFIPFHHASRWINTAQICVSLCTALIVCWPNSKPARSPNQQ